MNPSQILTSQPISNIPVSPLAWFQGESITGVSDGDEVTVWPDNGDFGNAFENSPSNNLAVYSSDGGHGRPGLKGHEDPNEFRSPRVSFSTSEYSLVDKSNSAIAVHGVLKIPTNYFACFLTGSGNESLDIYVMDGWQNVRVTRTIDGTTHQTDLTTSVSVPMGEVLAVVLLNNGRLSLWINETEISFHQGWSWPAEPLTDTVRVRHNRAWFDGLDDNFNWLTSVMSDVIYWSWDEQLPDYGTGGSVGGLRLKQRSV